jgi:hypothetical protein
MSDPRTGGCSCGAVRYSLRGEPFKIGICHCTVCRKESGSAFSFYAQWTTENCEVTGDYRTFEDRSFCPICGSRLFEISETDIEVKLGSLDEAPVSLASPHVESWIGRRELWLLPVGNAKQHNEN